MIFEVIARIKTRSGKTIGYRLKSNNNTIDIDISNIRNYNIINGKFDRNNIFRCSTNDKIENIIQDSIVIQTRKTHMVGKPAVIYRYSFGKISNTQQTLLNELANKDCIEIDKKKSNIKITMKDLSVLTAVTGVEYTLFERSDKIFDI